MPAFSISSSSRSNSVLVSSIDAAAALGPTRLRIEHEVADLQRLVRLGERGAAQERAQPGEQLVERERLHEVVVGAGVEPGDPIGHLVAGGQHEDRERAVAVAELAAHGEAVDVGHHHVEHDDVGLTCE